MPQTRECDYCGSDIEPGTGVMFVRTDGTTIHYCSSKCEANDDLGREPRDVEWTEEGGGGEADRAREEAADEAEAEDEESETAEAEEAEAEESDAVEEAAEDAAEAEEAAEEMVEEDEA
ncbi:50S ribosomal protein L24e [Halobacteriales archaeon QS_1_68_20]|nr:MAG: 50S ribosomal protein L24e [Halobacteriales archaeon QS_1_68_20]